MKKRILLTVLFLICQMGFAYGQGLDQLKEKADQLWTKRDDKASLLECLAIYNKALNEDPQNEELLTILAIGNYWKGNHLKGKENKSARMEAFQTGMAHAAKLCELDPRSVPGNFWHATNNASLCREKGFFKSAVNFPNIRKRIDLVLEEDKFYYDGGPGRLRARIIWFAPKLGRSLTGSLKDAEKYLNEAIAAHPNFTLSHLFLADLYWKTKKKEQCRAELMTLLEIPENSLPQYSPENRRDKIDAKERLSEYFNETF